MSWFNRAQTKRNRVFVAETTHKKWKETAKKRVTKIGSI